MFPAAKFGCVQAIKTFDQCYDRHTTLQMFCPYRKLVISETHTLDNVAGNNQVQAILGRKCFLNDGRVASSSKQFLQPVAAK